MEAGGLSSGAKAGARERRPEMTFGDCVHGKSKHSVDTNRWMNILGEASSCASGAYEMRNILSPSNQSLKNYACIHGKQS